MNTIKMNETGDFRVHEVLRDGFVNVKSSLESAHPLEESERNYQQKVDQFAFTKAMKIEGINLPLKLMAERRACSTINRLPCLPSSNLMLATLRGDDDFITYDDVFNDPSTSDVLRNPNLEMDKANWTGF